MGARQSLFMHLIELKAEQIIDSSTDTLIVIQKGIERHNLRIESALKFHFKQDEHSMLSNKHTSQYNNGCGCAYCQARHTYVREKMKLHRVAKMHYNSTYFYSSDKEEERAVIEKEVASFAIVNTNLLKEINKARIKKEQIKRELLELGFKLD